jgi:CheY-specific phosphatase CheX
MTPEAFTQEVRHVLEGGALLFIDPVESDLVPDDADIHLQLRFDGRAHGVLRLDCHHDIGTQIARNMLGLDDSQPCPSDLAQNSLHEILNILGGTVITHLAQPGQMRLKTPEPNSGFWLSGQELKSQWSVEGLPLAISLCWRES